MMGECKFQRAWQPEIKFLTLLESHMSPTDRNFVSLLIPRAFTNVGNILTNNYFGYLQR